MVGGLLPERDLRRDQRRAGARVGCSATLNLFCATRNSTRKLYSRTQADRIEQEGALRARVRHFAVGRVDCGETQPGIFRSLQHDLYVVFQDGAPRNRTYSCGAPP